MEKKNKHIIWFVINLVWWIVSIVAATNANIDTNPLVNTSEPGSIVDPGEIFVNILLWLGGHAFISVFLQDEQDVHRLNADDDVDEEDEDVAEENK